MEITINTMFGTYIVPKEKVDDLILWLKCNATLQGSKSFGEIKEGQYEGRQLLND